MWFIKQFFIAFDKHEKIDVLTQVFKKKNLLNEERQNFEKLEDFEKYVKEKIDDNPQTYTSTIIHSINQGVIDSCFKQKYLEKEIDYDNVKILCLGKYSFYISIYDLQKFKNKFSFPLDFIYSPFAIIDYLAKEKENRFYVLVFENYLYILGYETFIPIFSDTIELNKEENEEEEIEEIDDLDIIDDIDSIDEIEEDIDKIDEDQIDNLEEKLDKITTSIETNVLKFIQNSLKVYYENYSENFIEKIFILDAFGIDENITKLIEDEILIECKYQKIDPLKIINRMSLESL